MVYCVPSLVLSSSPNWTQWLLKQGTVLALWLWKPRWEVKGLPLGHQLVNGRIKTWTQAVWPQDSWWPSNTTSRLLLGVRNRTETQQKSGWVSAWPSPGFSRGVTGLGLSSALHSYTQHLFIWSMTVLRWGMNCLWEPHVSQARHHLLRKIVPFLAWQWARDLGLSMEGLEKTGCQMWGMNIQELANG